MDKPVDPTQSQENELDALIAEYLGRIDRGEKVDPEQFIAPYPELAESFRQYLRDAALVDGLDAGEGPPGVDASASRDTADSMAAEETIPPTYVSGGQQQAAQARQFGRYRLVKLLGQGAMGAVYLAEDPELQRHVALKIPKFSEDETAGAIKRFYREARAAATLDHPNICRVHDIGEQDGTPFMTMAYVQGQPLSEYAGAKRRWPERDVANLVRKIALALAEAHAKGVVHRDLKPGNVMLDQRREPIVMDFGLAGRVNRPGEEKLTQAGALLGTPAYMSPEQAGGELDRVGPHSDVFSLGVILYELLTGQVPFRGPIAAVIVQIVRDQPRRPSELRPAVDKRIEDICLKMMAKAPGDRYATAADVAAALRKFLEETATGGKSSRRPAAEAARKSESRKQEIVRLLQGGQFSSAIDALEELARAEGPGADQYAAWARGELARVRSLPQELLDKGPAIVEAAIELIASQEYAEVVRLLEAVPDSYRSTEAAKLLDKATKLQREADELNAHMRQAVRTQQYEGLQDDLGRLLELQPGNLVARELYDKLGTYAPGRPYRFGKDGKLLSAHRTPLWVLLGSTLRQALRSHAQRQKYRREPAGKRVSTPTEPVPPGSGAPILPVAIAAVAFALILLTIVILLRDGRQVVRVEIDDDLLADTSITLLIDGREMEIAGLGETIKLKPGEHGYELHRGDAVVRSCNFTVLKGDNPALEISLDTATADTTLEPPATAGPPQQRAGKPPLAVAPFDEKQAKRHQQAWAEYLGVPVETTNSIGMKLALIPPGEFMMGTPEGIGDRDEHPQHKVRVTKPFHLGIHEVTVGQFRTFVEASGYKTDAEKDGKGGFIHTPQGALALRPECNWRNPGFPQSDDHPVVQVSWNDATEFCRWLSEQEDARYRLPTEAEWEYACRAGTMTRCWSGNAIDDLRGVANIADQAFKKYDETTSTAPWDDGYTFTAPVGSFRANPFGLYDMHGNVLELCEDWANAGYYATSPLEDPICTEPAGQRPRRRLRVGAFNSSPELVRSANKGVTAERWCLSNLGFRVARTIDPAKLKTWPGANAGLPRSANVPRTPLPGGATEITEIRRFEGHTSSIKDLAYSPDGRFVLSAENNGGAPARLWDVATGKEVRRFLNPGGSVSVAISPDSRLAAIGSYIGQVVLWDMTTGGEIRKFRHTRGAIVRAVVFSPNSRFLLSTAGGDTRLWSIESGEELYHFDDKGGISDVSPNSRQALFRSGNEVILVDLESRKEIRRLGTIRARTSASFSPDGKYAICGGQAGRSIGLWDLATGEEIRRFEGQEGPYVKVRFLPSGRRIVSSSFDKTLRLWDVETGEEIARITGDKHYFNHLAISPDGRFAVTGGGDSEPNQTDGDYALRLWRLPEQVSAKQASGRTTPAAGWVDLFNGRDLTGWRIVGDPQGVAVNNGVITLSPAENRGWLATEGEYADFELEVDYKLVKAGDSGVFLRIPDTGAPNGADFLQIQLLDDGNPKFRNIKDWQRTGAIWGVAPPSQPATAPTDTWNRLTIKALGPQITVGINGRQILATNVQTAIPLGHATLAHLKRATGHIGLQRHESQVHFRNIRIRELTLAETGRSNLSNPDRPAAEWVLSLGGTVKVSNSGQEQEIKDAKDLPKDPFQLTEVDLFRKKEVDDDSLKQFEGLKGLRTLGLRGSRISDTGLNHLKGLTSLRSLTLKETQVTAAGVADLKKALPGLEIIADANT